MNVKTNYLAFCFFSLYFLLTSGSCKNVQDHESGNTEERSSIEQSHKSDSLKQREQLLKILGDTVPKKRASDLTTNYLNTLNAAAKEDSAKSVYFSKSELDAFAQDILDAGLCSADSIGFRLYFAKYKANDTASSFPGQMTIVIRATCNGKDIPHQINGQGVETTYVAYDFGDVCPPRCDLKNPGLKKKDGSYNTNGNCNGCPQ